MGCDNKNKDNAFSRQHKSVVFGIFVVKILILKKIYLPIKWRERERENHNR
jgi:hypothetical protein